MPLTQHQLNTIHLLPSDDISQPTEQELTDEGADGGSDLEAEFLVGGQSSALGVDEADHARAHVDGEDVIGVGEESDTSNCGRAGRK